VAAYAPLRHRDFRLLWTGLLISNTGSWMQFVALGYLVDRLTRDPLYLGLLAAVQAAARIVAAPVGGALADRMDRRRLLQTTNVVLLAVAALLAALTARGTVRLWQILALAALSSLVQAFDMPARHSLVPLLVEEREVLTAVTLNSVAFNGSAIFGPSLAGVVITTVGEAGCFFLNAVSFLAVVAAVRAMASPPHPAATGRLADDLADGVRLVREHPRLGVVLAAVAAVSFFGRPYVRLMPAFAREELHVGATALGLLQAAPGVGTVAAAVAVGRLATGGATTLLVGAALGFGFLVAVFGQCSTLPAALVVLVLVGTAQSLALSAANALVQLATPPQARGRIMGLYSVVAFGGFALGSLPVGALASAIGVGPALSVGGVAAMLAVVALASRLRPQPAEG
jgi:MFS family permease